MLLFRAVYSCLAPENFFRRKAPPVNIQLAPFVTAERVGDTVVLLNSRTHSVYSLPTGIVADVSGNTLTMSLLATPDHIYDLAKHQLIDTPPTAVSRRGFLSLTTATVGGGLVAMSLPTVAVASSMPAQTVQGAWWVTGTANSTDVDALSIRIDLSGQVGLVYDEDTWTVSFFNRTFSLADANDPDTGFVGGILNFLDFDVNPTIPEINAFYGVRCEPDSNLSFSATLNAGGVVIPVTLDYDQDELADACGDG
jgi:hypothetical protein